MFLVIGYLMMMKLEISDFWFHKIEIIFSQTFVLKIFVILSRVLLQIFPLFKIYFCFLIRFLNLNFNFKSKFNFLNSKFKFKFKFLNLSFLNLLLFSNSFFCLFYSGHRFTIFFAYFCTGQSTVHVLILKLSENAWEYSNTYWKISCQKWKDSVHTWICSRFVAFNPA